MERLVFGRSIAICSNIFEIIKHTLGIILLGRKIVSKLNQRYISKENSHLRCDAIRLLMCR